MTVGKIKADEMPVDKIAIDKMTVKKIFQMRCL
jgi:hypothetical protein